MKDTGRSYLTNSTSLTTAGDEIPEALRDSPIEPSASSPLSRVLATLAIVFGLSALGLAATLAWMLFSPSIADPAGVTEDVDRSDEIERDQPTSSEVVPTPRRPSPSRSPERSAPSATGYSLADPSAASSSESSESGEAGESGNAGDAGDAGESGDEPPAPPPDAVQPKDDLFGHLPYEEAPIEDLAPVTNDGSWMLRRAAAESFWAMQADARAEGVDLSVLSAFRTIPEQQSLFFDVKAERGQSDAERAKVSAPPGYSEHHTGYAIDLGDATEPGTALSEEFEQTLAYAWLTANAAYYSFELSFPPNNEQGIAYEPWHWRFVGDHDSLETFYRARSSDRATP